MLGRRHRFESRLVGPLVLLLVVAGGVQSGRAAAEGPVVRVAYFIPNDREPEPDHRARLDRVMTEVQRFYRAGMRQNGYGALSFELDRDASGALRIHEVRARGPMSDYGRDASGKVGLEVKSALAKEGIDVDRETVIIFQLLLDWRGGKAVEIGPYVGGGGPRGGIAWVYDDARLDPRSLGSRDPGGYYVFGPCSIGEFNSHYIGGIAHELGHAFGLPHVCERDRDRPGRGLSLMGGGNHTYGQELRGEGKGSFLSAASALALSVHPLFTGRRSPASPMTCRIDSLEPSTQAGSLVLSGRLTGGPPAVGIAAFNDPEATPGDYDAVGWTCPVTADGAFRLVVGDPKPGDHELRLTAFGRSGDSRTFSFRYGVDRHGQPDLRPFTESVLLQRALSAFRSRDKERLTEIVGDARTRYAADEAPRRKVEHLLNLLSPPPLRPLAETPADARLVHVGDLRMESATVGWGSPLANQVLPEGESSPLLEVGDRFFESGLYAHAPARYVLRPDGKWTRFQAGYGLQNGHGGSVRFVVRGDGKELFRSPVVRDHRVREQVIDVARVELLELIVEDGGDGGNSDWGVWLDPQLRR